MLLKNSRKCSLSHCLDQHSFSNQSLRLYKKISFTRRQGCRGFQRFREVRENDCITEVSYYPRFVYSSKRRGLKQKQNVEYG